MVSRRNNIVMVKRDVPKKYRVVPNGRVFYAKHKRVTTQSLPAGARIARTYKGQPAKGRRRPIQAPAHAKPAAAVRPAQRPRRRLRGRGISDVAQTVVNNPFAQQLGKRILTKGVNSIPYLIEKATKKIKNKKLRKVAQSEIASDIINEVMRRIDSLLQKHNLIE